MACDCLNFTCLSAKFNPCSEGVQLALVATETGNWTGEIEFGGAWESFEIGVIEGEKVVIPADLLNESYTHVLKLFGTDGELVGGVCYQLKAQVIYNSETFPVLPPTPQGEDVFFDVVVTEDGVFVTDDIFSIGEVLSITTDAQYYDQDYFTQGTGIDADTLTSQNNGDGDPWLSFYAGQILTVKIRPSAYSFITYDVTVSEDGNTLTDARFDNGKVILLETDSQDYNKAFFTQGTGINADTLTSKNDGEGNPKLNFYIGQIISVTQKTT